MRVISGVAKGTKLKPVPGEGTRPTTDRVKESLFNLIQNDVEGADFLDLYAGSGAIGIEALSRGASSCVFLEIAKKAYRIIKDNLEAAGLKGEVRHTDAFQYLRNTSKSFDLIYVDPPRYEDSWSRVMHLIAERPDLVNPAGKVIVEIDPNEYELLPLAAFQEVDQRTYGSSMVVQYQRT